MTEPNQEDSLVDRLRVLTERLDRARRGIARTEEVVRDRGPVPVPGDLLMVPGEDELLVVASEGERWLVVPVGDAPDDSLVLDNDLSGPLAVDLARSVWTTRDALAVRHRSGAVPEEVLSRAREALIPKPRSRSRTWWLVSAAACAALVLGGVTLLGGHVRANPGRYAYMNDDGEVGAELVIGDEICLAKGVEGSDGACRFSDGAKVDVGYRLDSGVEYRYLVVIFDGEDGTREVLRIDSRPLAPTAIDGEERCARGMCALEGIDARPGTLSVVFLPRPPKVGELPPGKPENWRGAMPYAFKLTGS